jgi:hypothetical protein
MSQNGKVCGCSEEHCTCIYCGYTFSSDAAAADHEKRRFHPGRHWHAELPRRERERRAPVRYDSDTDDDEVVASDNDSESDAENGDEQQQLEAIPIDVDANANEGNDANRNDAVEDV